MTTRTATRGVLYVHSAPSALCPHIEWAAGGVLGNAVSLDWTPQGAQAGTYRAEFSWAGEAGTAAAQDSSARYVPAWAPCGVHSRLTALPSTPPAAHSMCGHSADGAEWT